jgi:glycosyltransferase involved in cell wall biosynthesis
VNGPVVAIDARLVCGTSTGDSTYWTSLVSAFARIDSDARFLLFSNAPRPKTIPEDGKFRWFQVPSRSSRWWSLVSFPLAARRNGAQALHAQYTLSPLSGRKGITTVHDVSFFIGPDWFRLKDRTILQKTVPAACRRAARVIAVSETCKKEIAQWIPEAASKTEAIPNACPDWIQRVERDEAEKIVRDQLGVHTPFLLTVGTRWPRKNMALAIEAANALAKEAPHSLVVTGKAGWGEENLGSRGKAVGYVDTSLLSALYSSADLYLAPSRHEGFGIPLLEAFRCGCPVLCSSGGAFPEVAGDAAIVEPTWDAAHWSRSIQDLLADPSKLSALRERGFRREKQFTWDESARRTLEVYREVAT